MLTELLLCEHCRKRTIRCTQEDGILDEFCPECDRSIFEEPTPPTQEDCWDGTGEPYWMAD